MCSRVCQTRRQCQCVDNECYDFHDTGCDIQRTKEQDWCRKQRAHLQRYKEEMTSDVLGSCSPLVASEERCVFEPYKPRRREQRHFPKLHNKSQLNL
ncbi:hypothetical protein BsWGS_10429 [Bradybaena similaris]